MTQSVKSKFKIIHFSYKNRPVKGFIKSRRREKIPIIVGGHTNTLKCVIEI